MSRSWHQEQASKLRQVYPGWEIWWVYKAVVQTADEPRCTWHARPTGALVSVCDAGTPSHLAAEIARYADDLAGHIGTARLELERTPPELHHLHAAMERELQALLVLQRSLTTAAV